MKFHERLMRERKARGLSQEELAALVGVSHQAVSKWENGDAMPDLTKLLALADALNLSLDTLCGRESAPPVEYSPVSPARSKAVVWLSLVCVLLFALLCISLVTTLSHTAAATSTVPASLPSSLAEDFFVSGLQFHGKSGVLLAYRFAPSIFGHGLTYQITFTNPEGRSTSVDAPCVGGICTGEVTLSENWQSCSVNISVTDGTLSRNLAVAHNLRFTFGECSWTPVK